MHRTNWCSAIALPLILVLGAAASAADRIVISFERSEGFPVAAAAPGSNFTGKGIPAGVVVKWTNDSAVPNFWFTDKGPGGVLYPETPAAITGSQLAGLGQGGNGVNVGTMHLNPKASLGLDGFYWAWRGNGDTRPGGNAWLEVEYFDLNGQSVGKDKFTGGLDPAQNPKFVRAKPSVQGGALSKVTFRGTPPDPTTGGGTFFLDDVTLSARPDPMSPFKAVALAPTSVFEKKDTTPPVVNLLSPPPDSTAAATAEIGAQFIESGSGIDIASAKLLLDGNDVTGQAKVTAEGIKLRLAAPLAKGIHRVQIMVSDKAGNPGNRAVWRFGAGAPVPVEARFEKNVFLVSEQPYFPIGIYNGFCDPMALTRKDLHIEEGERSFVQKCLSETAASGVNCQMLGESMSREDLDVLIAHGMKGMKAVSSALVNITEADTSLLKRHADYLKDHPGLLAWWASDPETLEASRKNMSLGYRTLRAEDPRHPVAWILSHGDKYRESFATVDVCFVYFYPILQSNMTITSTIHYVFNHPALKQATAAGKQVWFASQEIDLRISSGERLASPEDFRPTPAEMRAMNYLAVIEGVKGLFFYAAGGNPVPEGHNDLTAYPAHWKELLKSASELRHLAPFLATGRIVKTAHTDLEAILFRELELDGTHVLIALNVGSAPIAVGWRFDKPTQPAVLFENRALSGPAAEMTDRFEPLEVHIYQWR